MAQAATGRGPRVSAAWVPQVAVDISHLGNQKALCTGTRWRLRDGAGGAALNAGTWPAARLPHLPSAASLGLSVCKMDV